MEMKLLKLFEQPNLKLIAKYNEQTNYVNKTNVM